MAPHEVQVLVISSRPINNGTKGGAGERMQEPVARPCYEEPSRFVIPYMAYHRELENILGLRGSHPSLIEFPISMRGILLGMKGLQLDLTEGSFCA